MKQKCIAMLLAGGQGSRLGLLTQEQAKPALPFGGKYRIIDFPLSNCAHSGIDTVGVLTQYQPLDLNHYIGSGQPWGLNRNDGGVFVLPPYVKGKIGEWYKGTANAIYQNIKFIEQYEPGYVVILSGDHIYKMNYNDMLEKHIEAKADVTIAVREVPWEEASSFGIMNTDEDMRIVEFEEKPAEPKSNKASMGVYVFTWSVLRAYLEADEADETSHNDFGHNIIPKMLADGKKLLAYTFNDYWKDVGTIHSLWEANMDLLKNPPEFNLYDDKWRIYARTSIQPPHYVDARAKVTHSMVTEGCNVRGTVRNSILFTGVTVMEDAIIEDSVIMPKSVVQSGAVVRRAIVGANTIIGKGSIVGEAGDGDIALVGGNTNMPPHFVVKAGEQVDHAICNPEEGKVK